jgi:hypothetical protein
MTAAVDGFDLHMLYGDGASLYEYLGSNPWMRGDPLGLSWDPFAWHVDEYLAKDAGSKAAFLERIVGGAHTTAYLATYIASWVPIPAIALPAAGLNALMGMPTSLAQNEAWQMVERMGHYAGIAMLSRIVAQVGLAAARTGAHYVMQHGSRVAPGAPVSAIGVTARAARAASYLQHVGRILPYSEAAKLTRGANHAIEAHHLIPRRYLHLIPGLTDDTVPAVVLLFEDHRKVVEPAIRAAQRALGGRPRSAQELRQVLATAYGEASQYFAAIRRFLP